MAYVSTFDERGSYWEGLNADDRDAPSNLNNYYVLAQDMPGFGNLTDDYVLGDQDVYSLGVLSTGEYSVDVDGYTWDFSNYGYGSLSSFQVLNSYGSIVEESYNEFTDINFTVTSADTYYVKIIGSSYAEEQYSVSYSKIVELNSPTDWDLSASYSGDLVSGETLDASIFYFDADGNSDGIVHTAWYVDGTYQGISDTFILEDSHIGKTVSFDFGLIDDESNIEISDLYIAGVVSAEPTNPVIDLNDVLRGGSGDDFIFGYAGNDKLYGGSSKDTLKGGSGKDKLYGEKGNDKLFGGSGKDMLKGGGGKDKLYGDSGKDKLYGGSSKDTLKGGGGKDKLDGGKGNDKLFGGSGADTFVFNKKSGKDTIEDFGGNDVIAITKGANRMKDLDFTDTKAGLKVEFGKVDIFLEDLDRNDISSSDFDFG